MAGPLRCPGCDAAFDGSERFCPRCGVPLVDAGAWERGEEGDAVGDLQARLRKVKPQYAEGDLVRVAGARNQVEAEFIQSLLLEEGIPSMLRRSAGFDVPDFLAAGPRDVLVPRAGAAAARDMLLEAELLSAGGPAIPPARVLAGLLLAVALLALIAWLGVDVLA